MSGDASRAPGSSPCKMFPRGCRMVRLERFEEPYRLAETDRETYRRRFTTLFIDDSTTRRGGLGVVVRATNVFGEACALKTLRVPERGELEDKSAYESRIALARVAFRAEYESHRSVSGFKGFPRLYGFAQLDGDSCIVMEWVEGVALSVAARMLAVDGAGRMAPLVAARLGRDLFDMLTRLELVGDGFVHRDLSPSNILVRTGHLSVAEQAAEGAFDLCLIDFGSSVQLDPAGAPGYTMRYSMMRRATPDYAPPEMLTDDARNVSELRKSEKIDVYAGVSVLFELVCGAPPFALSDRAGGSPYRIKMDEPPRSFVSAHHAASHLGDVLAFEPEVQAAVQEEFLDMTDPHDAGELRLALDRVDAQLAELLYKGLVPLQNQRASAREVRDGLTSFCVRYAQNVRRALHGERLLPCVGDAIRGGGVSAATVNKMVGVIGFALSGAALFTVMCVTALLLDGVTVTFHVGTVLLRGEMTATMVFLALGLPAMFGLLGRGRFGGTCVGFVRATCALVAATLMLLAVVSEMSFSGIDGRSPLLAALFLAAASGWCPLVLEFATMFIPDALGAARRALPSAWSGWLMAAGDANGYELGDAEESIDIAFANSEVTDAPNAEE